MTIDPAQLLKRLEPAVRPAGVGVVAMPPRPGIEQQSFDDLLSLVSTGSIHSGRAVQIETELSESLDDEQMGRLRDVADVAEAAGVKQALLLLDGRGLALDVESRAITLELDAQNTREPVRIEAAIHVAGPDDELPKQLLGAPGMGLVPPGLAGQIEMTLPGNTGKTSAA